MKPGGLVVVGDALLDRDVEGQVRRICPDAPAPVLDEASSRSRPGGAALAAALAAARARRDQPIGPDARRDTITLISAVCPDRAGDELSDHLAAAGVELLRLPARGATPEKIRLRCGGHTLLRLDRGSGPVTMGPLPPAAAEVLAAAGAVLVSDYGRGVTSLDALRAAVSACGRPIVWDPHPRGAEPVAGCRVVTPNAAELLARWGEPGSPPSVATLTSAGRRAVRGWAAAGAAVTWGEKGALLVSGGDATPLVVPVADAHTGDPCGAGDCFAASVGLHLAAGALPSEAVARAVADASSFVAQGGAAAYPDCLLPATAPGTSDSDAGRVVTRIRAAGGTVVAAGGCFDLLHAGHVTMLKAARALGDCLVVCLNSDRSVRRLKGPGRPVNPERDRAATLAALDCVDAVAVFDEDTPDGVIRRLRPDLWVKGGDYDAERLPETATLAEWGGQAVVLPYLAGRSTTGILARASSPYG